ncbi:TlpA family protein disulfide reductase [Pedobacter rhodius]|uniref:Alkyl hydroperoxide reductase subunit C/ Thiol specific antioxidant domain-containing protein n=1 Tax=Pedobacter rhodius TaxID=3004098 RepID=A0ABT4KT80_9SPHI|nr:hypothetical protein [Pedobacter sp. SJ11]MCZ4222044.1 hypothetical protein [Pedobacter sp. SJ11]
MHNFKFPKHQFTGNFLLVGHNHHATNIIPENFGKKDPSKFDVVNAYKIDGIPTWFIIDGKGNIRFKSVGFSDSDDGVVKE